MTIDNKNLKVLGTHFGITGDLNDNGEFLDIVSKVTGKEVRLVEYFNDMVSITKVGDHYVIYFTVVDYHTDYVDGYVAQADEIAPLIAFYFNVKSGGDVDYAVLHDFVTMLEQEGHEVDVKHLYNLLHIENEI